ncbi:MAG: CRP-like cAMP-binding protein [Flavobacteriales bacterium]|jgi:CRP-like cAMP-binding protein
MKNLESLVNLDAQAFTKTYKKGTILQRAGEESNLAFYVKKGLLRSYTIDEKGKEHIFMFAPEGWLISDIESQEFNLPAELYIECLEDSEVVSIDRKCFSLSDLSSTQLLEQTNLLMRRVAVLQRRIIAMMSANAKSRYLQFTQTYPELPNRVPQKMIASYLGITPEALSKIRGEIVRNS